MQFNLDEIEELDNHSLVQKIVTEARESQDAFIFDTIYPFCTEVSRMTISKEELREAILSWPSRLEYARKQTPKKPVLVGQCDYYCPSCVEQNTVLWTNYNGDKREKAVSYCPICGQAIDWSDEMEGNLNE